MIRVIILVILFFYTLQARENPFFFESNLKQLPYTSNIDKNLPPLHRAALTLPSKARTIEKVVVTYKTLDGSVEEKEIILGNSVDWHLPIFISQNYMASEISGKSVQSKPKVKRKVKPKKSELKKHKVDKIEEKPLPVKTEVTTDFKEIVKRQYIRFLSSSKKLKLVTKSVKIRDFLLVKPHRIVLDFKKKSDIIGFVKKVPNNIFKKVVIGNHDGYYRVVIELDGYYQYSVKKLEDGYLITLH